MKLSPTQQRALSKLTNEWQSVYELKESLPTLNALCQRGLAISYRGGLGSLFNPRVGIAFRLAVREVVE